MGPTEAALRRVNRAMIASDLLLGAGALLAPEQTLRALGHERPSEDARHLFRRCGPIWLTFAAAHAVASVRDRSEDWHAMAWLRGTEIATDVVWSASPALSRPGARTGMRLAGAFNLALAAGFAQLASARRRGTATPPTTPRAPAASYPTRSRPARAR